MEKEDINSIGSTSSDSDIGTSKKKVPGLRDAADSIKVPNKTATSLIPVDSNACDSSPYIRMKGLFHHSEICVTSTKTPKDCIYAHTFSQMYTP